MITSLEGLLDIQTATQKFKIEYSGFKIQIFVSTIPIDSLSNSPSLSLLMFFPITSILIAMFSIQFGASVAKSLFGQVGPVSVTFLRLWFAALILGLVFRPWNRRLAKGALWPLIFYGASLGLMNLTFYLALQRVPLGLAVALEFAGPLLLTILSSRKMLDLLWVFMASVGLYIIMFFRPSGVGAAGLNLNHIDPFGGAMALIAGGFWAAYIFFGGRLSKKIPSTQAAAWGMFTAAIIITPFCLTMGAWHSYSAQLLSQGLFVAFMSSAIPYTFEMFALKSIPTKNFGILMSLEPVVASLSGFVMLRESLSPAQLGAVALIVSASLGSVLTISRKRI